MKQFGYNRNVILSLHKKFICTLTFQSFDKARCRARMCGRLSHSLYYNQTVSFTGVKVVGLEVTFLVVTGVLLLSFGAR